MMIRVTVQIMWNINKEWNAAKDAKIYGSLRGIRDWYAAVYGLGFLNRGANLASWGGKSACGSGCSELRFSVGPGGPLLHACFISGSPAWWTSQSPRQKRFWSQILFLFKPLLEWMRARARVRVSMRKMHVCFWVQWNCVWECVYVCVCVVCACKEDRFWCFWHLSQ